MDRTDHFQQKFFHLPIDEYNDWLLFQFLRQLIFQRLLKKWSRDQNFLELKYKDFSI